MAVFRVERNTGYTVMSNHHLRNKELSLKAKGLLSQMLSLPEDWDYTLSLEDIYTRFNIDHPKDFKGHSLSVSDVVVLHQNGQDAAHYVDSFGYKEVPEFLQEQTQQPEKINPLKHVEDTIEQNDNWSTDIS